MIKSKLVERISLQTPHRYRQDAEKIVNIIFAEITAAMARGDRVELRGFGVFFVKLRKAAPAEIRAPGPRFRSHKRAFLSLGPERK